MNAQSVADLSN